MWCIGFMDMLVRWAQNINASCQIQSLYDYHFSCIWVKQASMWATYYNIAGNNFNLLVLLLFVERIGCFLISNFIAKYIISPTRKGRKITEGITLIIGESVTILFIIEKKYKFKISWSSLNAFLNHFFICPNYSTSRIMEGYCHNNKWYRLNHNYYILWIFIGLYLAGFKLLKL